MVPWRKVQLQWFIGSKLKTKIACAPSPIMRAFGEVAPRAALERHPEAPHGVPI